MTIHRARHPLKQPVAMGAYEKTLIRATVGAVLMENNAYIIVDG